MKFCYSSASTLKVEPSYQGQEKMKKPVNKTASLEVYRSRMNQTRKDFQRKIGKLIRELRVKKRLTQDEAADRLGWSLEQWRRCEEMGVRGTHVFLKIVLSLDGSLSCLPVLLQEVFPPNVVSRIAIGRNNAATPIVRDMNLREIQSLLREEKRPWVQEKLQALAWLAEGMKVREVKERLGRRGGLIRSWLWRYNRSGIGWVLRSRKCAPPQGSSSE